MKENDSFRYTYSAQQQDEIKQIREKYLPHQENKLDTLRQLDRRAAGKALALALAAGIVGTLALGFGMSLIFVWQSFALGIPIGIVGLLVMSAAYPLYMRIIRREREKVAPEVMALTDELLNDQE